MAAAPSGAVLPAARLVASNGAELGPAAISGSTIAAVGNDPGNGSSAIYVFSEPAAGWSGTVTETAKLTDSAGAAFLGGEFGGSLASGGGGHGGILFAATPYKVDVFTEPADGWTGALRESASLTDPGSGGTAFGGLSPVGVSGGSVLAGYSLFREPSSGWSGTVKPVGSLFPASAYGDGFAQAFSGDLAVIGSDQLGAEHNCPCAARLSVFTEPAGGWNGTITSPPAIATITQTGPPSIALEAGEMFVTGGGSVDVYDVTGTAGRTVGAPRLSGLSLSGLATAHPRLAFTISGRMDDPPLESLTLTLPSGLSFAKSHLRLAKGVSITGTSTYSLSVTHGALSLRLAGSTQHLAVDIRARALHESTGLAARARRARRLVLRATLHATDIAGGAVTSPLTFVGT